MYTCVYLISATVPLGTHGVFEAPLSAAEQSECLVLRDPHPPEQIPCRPFSGPFFHHFFKPHFFMTFIPKCLQIGVPKRSKIHKNPEKVDLKTHPQSRHAKKLKIITILTHFCMIFSCFFNRNFKVFFALQA